MATSTRSLQALERATRDLLADLRSTGRHTRSNTERLARVVAEDLERIGDSLMRGRQEPAAAAPFRRPSRPAPPSRKPGVGGDFHTRHAARRSRAEMVSTEGKLFRAGTPQDVTSVRAKSQRHRKSTADRWNQ